jgi:hypothetical protein
VGEPFRSAAVQNSSFPDILAYTKRNLESGAKENQSWKEPYHSGDLSDEACCDIRVSLVEFAESEAVTQESLGRSPHKR